MVVEDRSKVILSTTERGFGITGMMTRWMAGHKLYHFKGKISQAMMTFDVDIGA